MSEKEEEVFSNNGQTLSEQFSKGWELFLQIENSDVPSNSEAYQVNRFVILLNARKK